MTKSSLRRKAVAVVACVGAGGAIVALSGCSVGATLGTQKSATFNPDPNSHLVQEVKSLYPDASKISVTWSSDNPNFIQWDSRGKLCTSYTSQTYWPGTTPKELVTAPWCRTVAGA